ncbi:hypothetical protein JMUB6875_28920 [Nocardia sp. JMUB6875]|uniref:ML domain-containing protein n=1 Tax=Nocardia sp. JMUB6875 TaxID=3158170 RepID=UPI0032E72E62
MANLMCIGRVVPHRGPIFIALALAAAVFVAPAADAVPRFANCGEGDHEVTGLDIAGCNDAVCEVSPVEELDLTLTFTSRASARTAESTLSMTDAKQRTENWTVGACQDMPCPVEAGKLYRYKPRIFFPPRFTASPRNTAIQLQIVLTGASGGDSRRLACVSIPLRTK